MKKKELIIQQAEAVMVHQHQIDLVEGRFAQIDSLLDELSMDLETKSNNSNEQLLEGDELLVSLTEAFTADKNHIFIVEPNIDTFIESSYEEINLISISKKYHQIELLDNSINYSDGTTWDEYQLKLQKYRSDNNLEVPEDPFKEIMSVSQQIALEKRIKDEFSLKNANCDTFDYMIAGTCGVIGGIIDILFVGMPGKSALGDVTDKFTNSSVEKFARMVGWKGSREGRNSTASAIGFLERKFKVNYDHRHTQDVDGIFKMSTGNHHIKSLGHSPDFIGLFFSILDQFQDKASFVGIFDIKNEFGEKIGEQSKLIRIDTETMELKGNTLTAKIYSGFINWLGHLFSDMAGSNRTVSDGNRGTGIPIPFYSLLQFLDIGSFGQHRQSFATLAVRVFEAGYDFRHGLTMAIPVIVTELLTRMMWAIKQKFYHNQDWKNCIPSAGVPELRRMLLISHGSLCLIDGIDAGLKSGGQPIQFLLRTNLIGWARFGTLALKEVTAMINTGTMDNGSIAKYLDTEYENLLNSSPK